MTSFVPVTMELIPLFDYCNTSYLILISSNETGTAFKFCALIHFIAATTTVLEYIVDTRSSDKLSQPYSFNLCSIKASIS